jgi:hypothetical protein
MTCAHLIVKSIFEEPESAVPTAIKHSDIWCNIVSKFIKIQPPEGRVAVLNVPGSIAHCCCLHLEAKKKRNELSHLLKNKKFYKRRILRDESIPTNDRLLHYAPYRIVIAPSF